MTQTWYCWWEAEGYPWQGCIEVQAETPFEAVEAGNREMSILAAMNKVPAHWRWTREPSTERP